MKRPHGIRVGENSESPPFSGAFPKITANSPPDARIRGMAQGELAKSTTANPCPHSASVNKSETTFLPICQVAQAMKPPAIGTKNDNQSGQRPSEPSP